MTKRSIPGLMDEPPISVYPSLAKALKGINKAIILQQLHFLLNVAEMSKNEYVLINGEWWVYNSYSEWANIFTWLSESSIKGLFADLERQGFIKSMQGVKDKWDRKKWYTLNYAALSEFLQSIGQNLSDVHQTDFDSSIGQFLSDDNKESETTTETTHRDIKDSAPSGAGAAKGKKPRKPNLMFNAVCQYIFETDPAQANGDGGRVGMIASWLEGKKDRFRGSGVVGFISAAATPEHVKLFAEAYKRKEKVSLPRDPVKFVEAWRKWASSFKPKAPIAATPGNTTYESNDDILARLRSKQS